MDIEWLRTRIAATIEKVKADDPRELKRRIADLERQLAGRAPAPKVEKVVERVEVPVIGDEQLRRLEVAVTTLAEVGAQLVTIAQDLGAALARVATPAPIAQIRSVVQPVDQVAPARTPPSRPTPAPRPADPTNGTALASDLSLRAGERIRQTRASANP